MAYNNLFFNFFPYKRRALFFSDFLYKPCYSYFFSFAKNIPLYFLQVLPGIFKSNSYWSKLLIFYIHINQNLLLRKKMLNKNMIKIKNNTFFKNKQMQYLKNCGHILEIKTLKNFFENIPKFKASWFKFDVDHKKTKAVDFFFYDQIKRNTISFWFQFFKQILTKNIFLQFFKFCESNTSFFLNRKFSQNLGAKLLCHKFSGEKTGRFFKNQLLNIADEMYKTIKNDKILQKKLSVSIFLQNDIKILRKKNWRLPSHLKTYMPFYYNKSSSNYIYWFNRHFFIPYLIPLSMIQLHKQEKFEFLRKKEIRIYANNNFKKMARKFLKKKKFKITQSVFFSLMKKLSYERHLEESYKISSLLFKKRPRHKFLYNLGIEKTSKIITSLFELFSKKLFKPKGKGQINFFRKALHLSEIKYIKLLKHCMKIFFCWTRSVFGSKFKIRGYWGVKNSQEQKINLNFIHKYDLLSDLSDISVMLNYFFSVYGKILPKSDYFLDFTQSFFYNFLKTGTFIFGRFFSSILEINSFLKKIKFGYKKKKYLNVLNSKKMGRGYKNLKYFNILNSKKKNLTSIKSLFLNLFINGYFLVKCTVASRFNLFRFIEKMNKKDKIFFEQLIAPLSMGQYQYFRFTGFNTGLVSPIIMQAIRRRSTYHVFKKFFKKKNAKAKRVKNLSTHKRDLKFIAIAIKKSIIKYISIYPEKSLLRRKKINNLKFKLKPWYCFLSKMKSYKKKIERKQSKVFILKSKKVKKKQPKSFILKSKKKIRRFSSSNLYSSNEKYLIKGSRMRINKFDVLNKIYSKIAKLNFFIKKYPYLSATYDIYPNKTYRSLREISLIKPVLFNRLAFKNLFNITFPKATGFLLKIFKVCNNANPFFNKLLEFVSSSGVLSLLTMNPRSIITQNKNLLFMLFQSSYFINLNFIQQNLQNMKYKSYLDFLNTPTAKDLGKIVVSMRLSTIFLSISDPFGNTLFQSSTGSMALFRKKNLRIKRVGYRRRREVQKTKFRKFLKQIKRKKRDKTKTMEQKRLFLKKIKKLRGKRKKKLFASKNRIVTYKMLRPVIFCIEAFLTRFDNEYVRENLYSLEKLKVKLSNKLSKLKKLRRTGTKTFSAVSKQFFILTKDLKKKHADLKSREDSSNMFSDFSILIIKHFFPKLKLSKIKDSPIFGLLYQRLSLLLKKRFFSKFKSVKRMLKFKEAHKKYIPSIFGKNKRLFFVKNKILYSKKKKDQKKVIEKFIHLKLGQQFNTLKKLKWLSFLIKKENAFNLITPTILQQQFKSYVLIFKNFSRKTYEFVLLKSIARLLKFFIFNKKSLMNIIFSRLYSDINSTFINTKNGAFNLKQL